MIGETFCPAYGEEIQERHSGIYECDACGNMVDLEIFIDEEEDK